MSHNAVYLREPGGRTVYPGESHTKQYPWVNAGSITAVTAAGQAPIDVDKRADADIVALAASKKIIYEPVDGMMSFEWRLRADGTEDDEYAIQFLAAAGVDYYTKIADTVCTQGTQPGVAGYFADAMARTNNKWLTPNRIIDAEADFIARFVLNNKAYDRFLWVCTNLQNATNIYIDIHRT